MNTYAYMHFIVYDIAIFDQRNFFFIYLKVHNLKFFAIRI